MIYLITVNYYSTDLITELLRSILKSRHIQYQIVIINNSSEDYSIYNIQSDSVFIIESLTNLGFGQACNLGLNWIYDQNPNAIVWVINPDTYLIEKALEQASEFFEVHPNLSILGTIIYTPSGEIWFSGGRFFRKLGAIVSMDLLSSNSQAAYVLSDWVSGCSLLINLRNFDQCPQFDPEYFLYYEDFDFCRRYANQGHLIGITNQIGVVHHASSITNRNIAKKIKHSTYSYLLTLQKYTNPLILFLRLNRLILYAIILFFVKPQVAFGKISGVLLYLMRVIKHCSIQYW